MFEQDRFVVRLQQSVMREPRVAVCFLAGSFGRRTEDEYSDMDVALVFDDEAAREEAWTRRRDFVKSVLPYVPCKSFDATHVRPHLHIALYANGAKVDYRYEAKELMAPQAMDREIRILKDEGQWAEAYQAASDRIRPPLARMEAAELETLDNRFWVMFWDIYRLLLRGDTQKPFVIYLELLYFTLPPLLQALPPEDSAHNGLLHARYEVGDAKLTLAHLQRLLDAYTQARSAVIRRYNVGFSPDDAYERALRQTMERHGP
jgi:hypothetical protein